MTLTVAKLLQAKRKLQEAPMCEYTPKEIDAIARANGLIDQEIIEGFNSNVEI